MNTNQLDAHCCRFETHGSRREFLARSGMGLGAMALGNLLNADASGTSQTGIMEQSHHVPKAKRVIYLFMSGGPSQLDLFDYKPLLNERHGEDLPDSVRMGQRLTGMSANQASFPMAGSVFKFSRHGQSGAEISELLPHTSKIADDLCIMRSLHTEAINHDPAITFFQTGSQLAGRPSMGSWLSYGLGSENDNLPAFCVLITRNKGGQPLYSRLWGNGFLPSVHQGVPFRAGKDPVLYLENPAGITRQERRAMLDQLRRWNEIQMETEKDPEIATRIAQYEMAYRMQTSVPEVMDLGDEPESSFELYGEDARKPGTFAANCLLARRLAERDVRFIQLFHQGWDQHGGLPGGIKNQCKETDQASAALVTDLKQRGLLDDTIVIWGGEFGRTNYSQGKLSATDYGRDHHPRCFSQWIAGGGFSGGVSYGETDEFGYNVARNGVEVHDLHATMLHQLGIHHEKLTFKYQGRRFRLTDIKGNIVKTLIT
ncbi:MAG: DUF1501 domain-containing protein [Verrucomicrobiota bacterium]|nr:DUF1501 domain-containing protein [Verrucomicrobiota bacterium]MDG1891882.1 DUF1501 domain-containing protein [Verrucomicrobiota bacterium]